MLKITTLSRYCPDLLLRLVIRYLLMQRLRQQQRVEQHNPQYRQAFHQALSSGPIALSTAEANAQHYAVPATLFQYLLGQQVKYSCAYWRADVINLTQAQETMLALYCQRAGIKDGDNVLDLGCGWGACTLYIATHYPHCHITALSNSTQQKAYIEKICREKRRTNVTVISADINACELSTRFDTIISIEMFEHMHNYQELMAKLHSWLLPNGKLFIHYFCHARHAYQFHADNNSWMAQHFFTNGIMPSKDLLTQFSQGFTIIKQWQVNGCHYSKTCQAWLQNLKRHKKAIIQLFIDTYGSHQALERYQAWRLFILACAECFQYAAGQEWFVMHYLLQRCDKKYDAKH